MTTVQRQGKGGIPHVGDGLGVCAHDSLTTVPPGGDLYWPPDRMPVCVCVGGGWSVCGGALNLGITDL